MSDGRKIIIVKKKKVVGGGHHGGSWKVAYADFVTAMMAFFMVMWIMSMDEGVKDMVQGYFENPIGYKKGFSGGQNILSQGNSILNMEIRRDIIMRRRNEEKVLTDTGTRIRTEIDRAGLLENLEADIEVALTPEGLRIELMETGDASVFFDRSSAALKSDLRRLLGIVGEQIGKLPNGVAVEGHTDAMPFGRDGYSNWELSVDRANAARRTLVASGVSGDHIVGVRGYADRRLKTESEPMSPRNRRITLLLPFDTPPVPANEDPMELVETLSNVPGVVP